MAVHRRRIVTILLTKGNPIMNQKRLFLIAFLLISMLACGIPGLNLPAAAPANPVTLSTIIAGTAEAAAAQTALAQPPATVIPAETPVPGATGTSLEQIEGGFTRYNDFDGGFEVTFPAGWLSVRPNADEFNASLASAGGNSMLRDQMTADQAAYEDNSERLYSYILRPDIKKNVIFGFSKLVWDQEDTKPLDDNALRELVQGFETSNVIPGFRVDTAQIYENANAVKLIEIGGRFTTDDGQGGIISFRSTVIFFKPTPNSLARITFSFLQDFNAQISPDVKTIIGSIKVAGP